MQLTGILYGTWYNIVDFQVFLSKFDVNKYSINNFNKIICEI